MAGRPRYARSPLASWPAPHCPGFLTATQPPSVQIFGRRDSRATQKAVRFFRERRVAVSFVDLAQRPIARGELRRFAERFSAAALLDVESRAYRAQGIEYMRFEPDELFERLLAEQQLLRLPLVRAGDRLAVGANEGALRELLDQPVLEGRH